MRFVVRCKHGTLVVWGPAPVEQATRGSCPPHCPAAPDPEGAQE